jgi:hypothetical protein
MAVKPDSAGKYKFLPAVSALVACNVTVESGSQELIELKCIRVPHNCWRNTSSFAFKFTLEL